MKDSLSRDPFELERLAEELVARERLKTGVDGDAPISGHDLPLHLPLSHDNEYLTADEFNVEKFLLSRSRMSLSELRAELRDYLATLKEELVKLINDDYEAFISLSTDLSGEGERLERLKSPLAYLKTQIMDSKSELSIIQNAILEKLARRASLREDKALLQLLSKISEGITRLESLLLIASPEPGNEGTDVNGLQLPQLLGAEDSAHDDRSRGSRAQHLGRVAGEYTQLLYHASKARADKCAFVYEVQWRIDRIKSTLSSDLDHLFASIVLALVEKGEKKLPETEKLKFQADLTECLRTYDILGLWRDAEDVLRGELVRPFIKKTIHSGALTAPLSPIVPHTPLAARPSAFLFPPHTPYNMSAGFVAKQHLGSAYGVTSPAIHLLDDSNDTLARLYNQLLRFVERDLKIIMELTHKVSTKSVPIARGAEKGVQVKSPTLNGEGFNIMANVVWAEIGQAIMDELGGVVFAAGRPTEFRQHHQTTTAFIRSLEFLAPSVESIRAMHSHPVYLLFERRWQLPVYFQLRWKEIVGKVEAALAAPRTDPTGASGFASIQAEAIWNGILMCWSAEIYIPDLCHRFWRLTLQLLRRFKTWLEEVLPPLNAPPRAAALPIDKLPNTTLSRAATPVPSSETPSAEAVAADDAQLRQFAEAIVDINNLESKVRNLWRDELCGVLPDTIHLEESAKVKPEDAFNNSLANVQSLLPPISDKIVDILSRRCCDGLLPVRFIPSQFRAMVNKRLPTEPSYFVGSILQPLKAFFAMGTNDGPGVSLRDKFLKAFAEKVFEAVCHRYLNYLSAMKKNEESLRRLKKGQSSTFSLFRGAASGKDDESRDQERIRTQMIIDVNAFSKDAESLGVDVLGSQVFQSLHGMVHERMAEEFTS